MRSFAWRVEVARSCICTPLIRVRSRRYPLSIVKEGSRLTKKPHSAYLQQHGPRRMEVFIIECRKSLAGGRLQVLAVKE